MNGLLEGKNILVMGVANKWSIAWAIAQKCYDQGAQLAFSYYGERSLRALEKLTSNMENTVFVECDVTKDENIAKAFSYLKETVGSLDGIAHCIAHADREDLKEGFSSTSRDGFAMANDISAYSLVAASKYGAELMSNGGSILTLTYFGGEKVIPNYNMMGVAKATLDMSMRYLACDFGQRKIRVNGISAGPIRTIAAKGIANFDKMLNEFENRSAMKRSVQPDEVGNTAVYLFSDLSSGVTGEIIHVDCGFSIMGC